MIIICVNIFRIIIIIIFVIIINIIIIVASWQSQVKLAAVVQVAPQLLNGGSCQRLKGRLLFLIISIIYRWLYTWIIIYMWLNTWIIIYVVI